MIPDFGGFCNRGVSNLCKVLENIRCSIASIVSLVLYLYDNGSENCQDLGSKRADMHLDTQVPESFD